MTGWKEHIQRLYLVRCYLQHKLLFFFSLAFIGAVLYGHKTSCEISPAIILGMYTSADQVKTQDLLFVTVDNEWLDLPHTIDEPRRMMIYSTLSAFLQTAPLQYGPVGKDPKTAAVATLVSKHTFMKVLGTHAVNTTEAYGRYMPWLRRYMQEALHKKVDHLGIYQLHIHYDENNLPVADYRKVLYDMAFTHTE